MGGVEKFQVKSEVWRFEAKQEGVEPDTNSDV